jgi:hypothetical protein
LEKRRNAMNPMKRLSVLAMLFILGGLCAAPPVLGGKRADKSTALVPPQDSPEPDAYGIAIFWGDTKDGLPLMLVKVRCENLTPGQEYIVRFNEEAPWGAGYDWFSVTADRKGKLSETFCVSSFLVSVQIEDDEGAVVLYGDVYW